MRARPRAFKKPPAPPAVLGTQEIALILTAWGLVSTREGCSTLDSRMGVGLLLANYTIWGNWSPNWPFGADSWQLEPPSSPYREVHHADQKRMIGGL